MTDGPPIWQQYQRLKRQHAGEILLFRLGDFYETFDADAELVARELEIVLTSREMGKGRRHPLAGIPHHALEGHLARLVARGHRVAICEQVSDPAASRGLVDRAVVRVVTPGTIVEPSLLDARANNYLAALVLTARGAGLAYVDVTTGEFACCQVDREAGRSSRRDAAATADVLRQVTIELERLEAAEVIVPEEPDADASSAWREIAGRFRVSAYDAWRFSEDVARDRLLARYGVSTLESFGCADRPLAASAAGAILQYVADTAPAAVSGLAHLRTYDPGGHMALDAATRRSLELTAGTRSGTLQGSLLGVLDRTRTAMGGRLLRSWLGKPLLQVGDIRERHDAVGALHGSPLTRARLGTLLSGIVDVERVAARVTQGIAQPRELAALRDSLASAPLALAEAEKVGIATATAGHAAVVGSIDGALVSNPPATVADGGLFRPGYSPELDALLDQTREAREWMATLEMRERDRTGLRALRVGYNKVFGYFLELSHGALRLAPTPELRAFGDGASVQHVLEDRLGYSRRQTLVGGERYVTAELKEKEQLVLEAQERIASLEARLYRQLQSEVATHHAPITRTAAELARLDCLLSFADVAASHGYVRPDVDDGEIIEIVAGRHPVVEQAPLEAGFVPNDARLACASDQVVIVTGPNMAGKSTFLRQVGLIVLMAQIGSFVPATEARIGIVDRVFTRVGAQDDIAAGQSTFMVEMAETAMILNHATRRSLLILDEIGRGTSTYDGLAIARAIVEHVHDHPRLGSRTLFATHYHELTQLAKSLPRVRNARVEVLEEGDRVVFLHRVVPGGADRSYGVHVAGLAGIPATVVQRARDLVRELERDGRRPVKRERADPRGLFDRPREPLLDELAQIDVDEMTPLQALMKLAEIRERARSIS